MERHGGRPSLFKMNAFAGWLVRLGYAPEWTISVRRLKSIFGQCGIRAPFHSESGPTRVCLVPICTKGRKQWLA